MGDDEGLCFARRTYDSAVEWGQRNGRPLYLVRENLVRSPNSGRGQKHDPPRVGDRIGELTVRGFLVGALGGVNAVRVSCSCGAPEHEVGVHNLLSGKSTRCMRCALVKATNTRTKKYYRYADIVPDLDHRRRLLNRIASCIHRCHGGRDVQGHYRARGISVWKPWREDRRAFLEYLVSLGGWDDPQLELDRIDNDRGYAPGNLRFVSRRQNANNRRTISGLQNRITELERENRDLRSRLLRAAKQIHDRH